MTLKEKVRIFACLNYDPGRKHLPENFFKWVWAQVHAF